jgi:uncharacterized protein (DUF1697 family)
LELQKKSPTIPKDWYVALLRGINVGGNNIISMKELVDTFERLGFGTIKTYINSGNIVFTTSAANDTALVKKIETAIYERFGFEVRVVVKSRPEVAAIVKKIPPQWVTDKHMRTEVLFLWSGVNKPSVLKQIATNPDVDRLLYVKGALIWNFDRADYKRSKIDKFIGTYVYKNMTGRNANTTRKLLSMMEG